MLSIIVAIANNNVIGKQGKLLWRISEDFIHTKNITMGHPIIMGQKTFESLPNQKPLAGRTNIVLTNDPNFKAEGVILTHSLDEALDAGKKAEGGEESFIFGGASLYKQTIDLADKLYVTFIDKEIEGDVYFPEIDEKRWKLENEEKRVVQFGDFELKYSFRKYIRQ